MTQTADNKRAITVGIFLFIGIAIFLLGVFTLGSQKKSFVKSFDLSVIFNNVQGLKVGNNIWFSGVKVGTIKRIQFYGTSQVKVFLSIETETQKYIHKDAKASISSEGLIGNKIVVIDGGSSNLPFVEDGDQLGASTELSTDDVMKTFQVNNQNLVDITSDFKTLAKQMVEGKGTIGAILSDEEVADNFKAIVKNLETTTSTANQMLVDLTRFTDKLNNKGGLADKMLTDTLVFAKLQSAISELQKTTASAAALTENLNKASAQLNKNDNAAGLLLSDAKTAESIKSIVVSLESSSKKLDQDLEALQHSFLLKGFFKKKAKSENKK
jgi:phospholipid/cholesterol/gamma-HCH transport system substrate-binding protein